MDKSVEKNGNNAVIKIAGQLISSDRSEFEETISDVFASGVKNLDFNMTEMTYMDSVGLGMLVTLRDEAEKNDAVVVLVEPQGNVKMLLEMARFDILFEIR
ncbi:MAG: STAS domain-containing protein [Rhodospirillales bacterium]|jgi:HptB-dependent secretion and biofilm anti anti-sigma factor|nr:STAS domain-containing protein [Rhodospirillales bacterium]